MAAANANAAPGATRPVDQHVEFVVKVSSLVLFPSCLDGYHKGLCCVVSLQKYLQCWLEGFTRSHPLVPCLVHSTPTFEKNNQKSPRFFVALSWQPIQTIQAIRLKWMPVLSSLQIVVELFTWRTVASHASVLMSSVGFNTSFSRVLVLMCER